MHLVPFLDFRGTGKSGVYLFFLLSSFLLSIPLLHKHATLFTAQVMGNYLMRRFLRIYPLYTLYLLAAVVSTLALTTFFMTPNLGIPYSLYPREFLRNFLLLETKGVTWSIAVEFKFYFILPFLVLIFHQLRRRGLRVTSLAFCLLVLACSLLWPTSEWVNNDPRLEFYLPIFLSGVYLAVLHDHITTRSPSADRLKKGIRILTPAALGAILFMTPAVHDWITGSHTDYSKFHRDFVVHAACWSVILMSTVHSGGLLSKFFSHGFLRNCGALSFSIYLFHLPVISILKRTDLNRTLCGWIVMLAALAASYVSFRFIERPMSRLKWPLNRNK
jgi:peptidoglycan/LPS O-acetylase OafA/YrhL